MNHSFKSISVTLSLLFLAMSCGGGGGGKKCDFQAQSGCDDGQVCEQTTDGKNGCFEPFAVRGNVFDLADETPIEGAHVIARDANGSVASTLAVTDADGAYELEVSVTRDEDGNPLDNNITLRADATGYQTFPGGVRQALPIDLSTAVEDTAALVVESSLTDIALIALEGGAGTASISGTVEIPEESAGALVVAENGGGAGFTALADREGTYKIFNLDADSYTVRGFAQGVNYDSQGVDLADDEEATVDLSIANEDAGAVSGSVQIVNAPGSSLTSVILAVESTFDETLVRGEVPPGLRAPAPGTAPNISGEYLIEGVPAGDYVILAAFEDDLLVRDPDLSIAGTSLLRITVAAGETTDVEGFKITEALNIISPGASGQEAVSNPPTFTWDDDSSEDEYQVTVFDSFGNIVWETSIDGVSGSDPSVTYDVDGTGAGTATALEADMFYQFRATSLKDGVPISQTEDLKGVFFLE